MPASFAVVEREGFTAEAPDAAQFVPPRDEPAASEPRLDSTPGSRSAVDAGDVRWRARSRPDDVALGALVVRVM